MGKVCKELIIKCENNCEDIFAYVSDMVEGMAYSCDMSDNGIINILEIYNNPDNIIADISKQFSDNFFEATAFVLSEVSGEMMDITYKYKGQLEIECSDWYGEREKAIKDGYYSESIWVSIKWKNTNDGLEKDANDLFRMILQKMYSKISISNLSMEDWINDFRINISGKKNKELEAIYEYKLLDPKENDIIDVCGSEDLYDLLTTYKNESFSFTVFYTYIDNDDIEHYISYDSRKDKASEEIGGTFYSNTGY